MTTTRILVVDDNLELAENVREMLEGLDHSGLVVRIAETAEAALHVAGEWGDTIDLAFLDLRLPDANGVELLHELKRLSPHAQIVLMTGYASVESAAAAVDGGAFAFVLKPFNSGDFLMTARRALAQVFARRERQNLQAQLEISERRHRELVEILPVLVLTLDEHDRITIFNRRLADLTGDSQSEMLGKPGRHLIGERSGDRKLETRRLGVRLIHWQTSVIQGPEGSTTYAIGTDVTEQREMMRRTLRAERLAAVGTLAAGLAHEVRNPLNSANLQLQVLKRRLAKHQPEGALQAADIVAGEIARLGRLVSEFLAFARPQQLNPRGANPNDLVADIHSLLAPEAEAKRIRLELELDPGVERVDLEPESMKQVLLNLTRNAIEAVPSGGRIVLRTLPADPAGNVSLQVEDDGPGFPEDTPVFDAFFTTKQEGTGLGLAIAHRIVSDHGGVLSVHSVPGCTCFSIQLPQRSRPSSRPPNAAVAPNEPSDA